MKRIAVALLVLFGLGLVCIAFIGLWATALLFLVLGAALALLLDGYSLPFEPMGSARGHPYHHLIASKCRRESLRESNDRPWRGGQVAEWAGLMAMMGGFFLLVMVFRWLFLSH